MSETSLLKALEILGLSVLAQNIYLELLKNNSTSLTLLMEIVGTSRVTFYKNLEILVEFGVCTKDQRGRWQAVKPAYIFAKLKAKQAELNKITAELEQNLPKYETIFPDKNKKTFVKIYSGKTQIQELAARFASDLIEDYIGFGELSVFQDLIGDEVDHFWVFERKKKKIKLRMLLQDKKYAELYKLTDKADYRETRYLKQENEILGYFTIHQNIAYCWASGHSRAIVISDEVFVASLRAMFEMLWVLGN